MSLGRFNAGREAFPFTISHSLWPDKGWLLIIFSQSVHIFKSPVRSKHVSSAQLHFGELFNLRQQFLSIPPQPPSQQNPPPPPPLSLGVHRTGAANHWDPSTSEALPLLLHNPTCTTWLEHLLQRSLLTVGKQHPEVRGCSRGLGVLPGLQGCSSTFCHHPPARPPRCLPHPARPPGGPAAFCSARRSVADTRSLSSSSLSKTCRRKTTCRVRLWGRDCSTDVRSRSFVARGPPEACSGSPAAVRSRVLRGK